MQDKIKQVAILGTSILGIELAALMAEIEIPVLIYDESSDVASFAINGAKQLEPPCIDDFTKLKYLRAVSFSHDLALLQQCDLIIDCINEQLDWKNHYYKIIANHVKEGAILATTTSSLSINVLAKLLPEKIRSQFCGMHCFHPPHYSYLVELIAADTTNKMLIKNLEIFWRKKLGKKILYAKDTPYFIGKRLGVFFILMVIHHADKLGLPLDVADLLLSKFIGSKRKNNIFEITDIVGLDEFAKITSSMAKVLVDDPWRNCFRVPEWITHLISRGFVGERTKQGIYKHNDGKVFVFDVKQHDYRVIASNLNQDMKFLTSQDNFQLKFSLLKTNSTLQGKFIWAVLRDVFHYTSYHLPMIANNYRDVDLIWKFAFSWENGLFEMWQAAGGKFLTDWLVEDIKNGNSLSTKQLVTPDHLELTVC